MRLKPPFKMTDVQPPHERIEHMRTEEQAAAVRREVQRRLAPFEGRQIDDRVIQEVIEALYGDGE